METTTNEVAENAVEVVAENCKSSNGLASVLIGIGIGAVGFIGGTTLVKTIKKKISKKKADSKDKEPVDVEAKEVETENEEEK